MKVVLYGTIDREEAVTWRVSLRFQVDCSYWLSGRRGVRGLARIDRELPLHRALALRDRWNRDIRRADQLRNVRMGVELIEWGRQDVPLLTLNEETASRLAFGMKGRALLIEEAASLAAEMQIPGLSPQLAEYIQLAHLQGSVEYRNGIALRETSLFGWQLQRSATCRRCGDPGESIRYAACSACGETCAYCEACLTMGRVKACSLLVCGVHDGRDPGFAVRPRSIEHWGLSDAQRDAVMQALRFLSASERRNQFLLWAVTGAGKTEMMFPILEEQVCRGRSVCIATPRKDVVLELAPRVRKAFPHVPVSALYGGSPDKFGQAGIYIATTHQLYRFYRGFDLMIIDELDAFPYHNNPALQAAAHKACADGGKLIYLSATPPLRMIRQAERGRIGCAKVPVRYHRRPLPVPRLIRTPPISEWRRQLPASVRQAIRESTARSAQLFVFVPLRSDVAAVVGAIRGAFPDLEVGGSSSQDAERVEKVRRFRERSLRVLVTTTIMERGVTVPRSDVCVLDADSAIFDRASLVQMAGRAGRSADDPDGLVSFHARRSNREQRRAIREIRSMNRLAEQGGYLRSS